MKVSPISLGLIKTNLKECALIMCIHIVYRKVENLKVVGLKQCGKSVSVGYEQSLSHCL